MARLKQRIRPIFDPGEAGGWRAATARGAWRGYAAIASIPVATTRAWQGGHVRERIEPHAPVLDAAFLRGHVAQSLLPFWVEHAVDRERGGYFTNLSRSGVPRHDDDKSVAMQARLVYALSAGSELGGDGRIVELAHHGVEFLVDHAWDRRFGGWYRTLTRNGDAVDRAKSTWVNAYVGLGFLEFHRMTGDQVVLDHAVRTDELLTRHMVDRMPGGYEEVRDRSWTEGSGRKVLCAQIDSLMFVEALHRATGEDEYRARADRLRDLLAVRVRDPRRRCALETFDRRWRYDPFPTRDRVSIGHHLKAARLLLEGFARTGNEAWLGAARELLEFAVRHGWDRRHGGFFHWVYRSGPVASPHKLWWTNAEALPALALMLRIDGGPGYRRLLEDQAAFCFRFFADPEFGEWYAACGPDGRVLDDRKGHPSKAAYHTVEACLATANHLQAMASRAAAGPTPEPAT